MLEAVKVGPGKGEACRKLVRRPTLPASARDDVNDAGREEETHFESKSKNRRRKKMRGPGESLTKKASYKGLGADSEEKHEPASDIDTVAVEV